MAVMFEALIGGFARRLCVGSGEQQMALSFA
jgi:hypothetical protein